MSRFDEFQSGQPRAYSRERERVVARAIAVPQEVNLSGMQVLAGMAFGIALVSMFVWGFIRHVLFAQ